jgi:hypothetical protein
MYIQYVQGLCQSRLSTADYALFLVASATTVVEIFFKVKVSLRLMVSQSVSLGVEPHLQLMTTYLLLWQLWSCSSGAPSLTRGRVCLLYMLLTLVSIVFLGSKSLGTRNHILQSQIWDFPFCCLLWLAGSWWRYSNTPQLYSLWLLCTDRVENTVSNSTSIVACVSFGVGTCLPSRCLEMALAYLLITQSLHSNGYTCYNVTEYNGNMMYPWHSIQKYLVLISAIKVQYKEKMKMCKF